jgi:branched-subunit amino acid aminotransferase/4-amino-4-deoxychorismate lyase
VLPGITRAAIIELAEIMNLPIKRRQVSLEELLSADEAFLTNSSWQILPITSMLVRARAEGDNDQIELQPHPIGDGGVGSITSDLRTALLALVDRETSGSSLSPG